MNILIDAQVMHGYYMEDRDCGVHGLTGDDTPIITRVGGEDDLWIDDQGHIEREWRNVVCNDEWLDGVFFSLASRLNLRSLSCEAHREFLRSLGRDFGFPVGSGDRWYIATAATLRDRADCEPAIISEDMDLHDPRKKHFSGGARRHVLVKETGRLRRALARKHRIHVRCVARHTAADQED